MRFGIPLVPSRRSHLSIHSKIVGRRLLRCSQRLFHTVPLRRGLKGDPVDETLRWTASLYWHRHSLNFESKCIGSYRVVSLTSTSLEELVS